MLQEPGDQQRKKILDRNMRFIAGLKLKKLKIEAVAGLAMHHRIHCSCSKNSLSKETMKMQQVLIFTGNIVVAAGFYCVSTYQHPKHQIVRLSQLCMTDDTHKIVLCMNRKTSSKRHIHCSYKNRRKLNSLIKPAKFQN